MKILKFQNFCLPPGQPCLPARFLGPGAKNQNSAQKVLFDSLSQFRKGVTPPPCPKTPGGDRFGRNPLFRGPGLTPRARDPSHLPKNYLQGVKLTLKIYLGSNRRVKSDFTQQRSQTDIQTDTHSESSWTPKGIFFLDLFYEWGDGKLQNLQNFYQIHFVKDKDLHVNIYLGKLLEAMRAGV